MTEASKVQRCESHAPGRIEPRSMFKTPQEMSCRIEDVYESQPWAIGFEPRSFLMENVGDNNVAANRCDIEGNEIAREALVDKGFILAKIVVITEAVIIVMVM